MSSAPEIVAADWTQVLLALLNVVQTIALAVMADRSRRVRHEVKGDAGQVPAQRRRRTEEPPAD